jgi:hypothetical protein
MKRYVIISSNDNPKYFYFTPIIIWAWKKIGWGVRMLYNRKPHGADSKQAYREELVSNAVDPKGLWRPKTINNIEGFQDETITQVSRLYGSCFLDPLSRMPNQIVGVDDFLMTSDIDMLPLSDIWSYPSMFKLLPVCWGRDLTDYHYPICYIGMSARLWYTVMGLKSFDFDQEIKRDLQDRPEARCHDKVKRWVTDQNIITERLLFYGKEKITHIDRGIDPKTHYPIGRVDRSHWTLDHRQLIDAHLPHDILTNDKSFHNVTELLRTVWPKEDFTWYYQFHKEFKKLL